MKSGNKNLSLVSGGDLADKIAEGTVAVISEEISKEIIKDEFELQIEVLQEKQKSVIAEVNGFIDYFTNKAKFFWTADDKIVNSFINFLVNDMPWKYNEAIFLNGLILEMKDMKSESPKGKKSGYYISNKLIETINFMLQKIDGTGMKVNGTGMLSFEKFISVFEFTQASLRLTESSKKSVQYIEKNINGEIDYRIQSLEHGVGLEGLHPITEVSTVLPKLEEYNDTVLDFEDMLKNQNPVGEVKKSKPSKKQKK